MIAELEKLMDRFDEPLTVNNTEAGMTYYCLGFLFKGHDTVALINKVGGWQDGMLNGLGVKIEDGETPRVAMVREFREEAGADVGWWQPKAIYVGKTWTIFIFSSVQSGVELRQMTDELPFWYPVCEGSRPVQDCPMVQMMIEICKRNVVSIIFDESSFS